MIKINEKQIERNQGLFPNIMVKNGQLLQKQIL